MSSGDRVRCRATGEEGWIVRVGTKRIYVDVDGAVGNPWPFLPDELERA